MVINGGNIVAWDFVSGADTYDVELLNAAAGAVLETFSVDESFISAFQLLAERTHGNYNVRVRAVEDAGPGDWSQLLALEYVNLPAPQNVRVE